MIIVHCVLTQRPGLLFKIPCFDPVAAKGHFVYMIICFFYKHIGIIVM